MTFKREHPAKLSAAKFANRLSRTVREIHHISKPVALPDDLCVKGRLFSQMRGCRRIDIAQRRNRFVLLMTQLKMA